MINIEKTDSIYSIPDTKNGADNIVIEAHSPLKYFLLAFQAIISSLLNLLHFPVALIPFLGLLPSETNSGQIIFNLLFCSGIVTVLQATIGIKFPVLVSPSNLLISGSILFLKSSFWEQHSNAALYAMGPSLRYEELALRSRELRGILILSGFVFSIICCLLWFLPIKLKSASITATLISLTLSSVNQTLGGKHISLLTLLVFSLSLVFYCIKTIKIPLTEKLNPDGLHVTFRHFSVLLSSIIMAMANYSENANDKLLDRTISSHGWYSFSLPMKDFVMPKLSTNSLVLLPVCFSQFIASYCCFRTISKEKEVYLKGLFIETILIVAFASTGVFVPMTIDPISIGLMQMTKIKHSESSVIAGGLLVLFSILVKMLALISYLSFPILCGISLFLSGQLLEKGLEEINSDETEKTIIAMSVLCGLVFSSLPIEIEKNILYSIAVLTIKSPVLITFVSSMMLSVAFKNFTKK